MAIELVVPQLGNEIDEAEVEEWLVAVGESVGAGDPVVALTTPKLTMEIEAPAAGKLAEIRCDVGEIVAVGAVLGILQEADG